MNLKLERPIIFFDLETTGVDVAKDSIVEIAMIKMFPDGHEEERVMRLNPGRHIPEEASAVHGIYDEDVKDMPTFAQAADELMKYFDDCDLAGYNSNHFDIPLLAEEFLRIGKHFDMRNRSLVDVQQIFHKMEQRTLVAAHRFYCGRDFDNAHSALADTRATVDVLKAQLDRYNGVEYEEKNGVKSCPIVPDVKALDKFTRLVRNVDFAARIILNDKDEEVFNFGKHKGKRVKDVFRTEPAFYAWMMRSDFPLNTKDVITRIYKEVKLEQKFQG
ncbi:MAG: 3'-5' exonuclease [Bacteroidales bacterium]|nr:3'-5' exonuclease [Bacteroidales bacterium]